MKLPATARGLRFDQAIHEVFVSDGRDVSVRELRRAIREGSIHIDGRRREPGDRAKGGEAIELGEFTPRQEAAVAAEPALASRVAVLFEDARLLALSKPSGMPTAPLRPGERGTLLGVAIARCAEIAAAGPPLEGGLVHRLDVGTSGVVVFAKDLATRAELRDAFSRGAIEKRYLALAFDPSSRVVGGVIDGWIGPGPSKDRVRVVAPETEGALPARTEVRVRERLPHGLVWIEARAVTGRRHQIRAHLASLGAPIIGDPIYGPDLPRSASVVTRLALHASVVVLPGGPSITADVDGELRDVLEGLRRS